MGRSRARLALLSVAISCTLIFTARGQSPAHAPGVVTNVGLPAIEESTSWDLSHTPGAPQAASRAEFRTALRRARTGGDTEYAPGRLVVKFRDSSSAGDRNAAVQHAIGEPSAFIASRSPNVNFDTVRIDSLDDAEVAADSMRYEPAVEYAQPDYFIYPTMVPNDPKYLSTQDFPPGQWNLTLINLERAWDIQPAAGSSIIVAVLDTGMAYTNATLTENIAGFPAYNLPPLGMVTIPYAAAPQLVGAGNAGRIVAPHDFIWNSSTPLDFDGHGTHVAGTIGQLTNDSIELAGVAFNVKLMPVKVLASVWDDLFGSPNMGTDAVVAAGIRYAADNGANIINMSLGRTCPDGQPRCAPALEDAINYAVGKGVFIVIAAGNDGEDPAHPVSTPAEIASRVPGAVSVAAVDRRTVGAVGTGCRPTADEPDLCHAYYSSTGSWVELAAPGGSERNNFGRDGYVFQQTFDFNVVDTYDPTVVAPQNYTAPRFDMFRAVGYIGTSMATPHVTGVAAMMMQQGIRKPADIEAVMEKYAIDLGAPGRDDFFGFGMIDALAVLRGVGAAR